MKKKIMLLLFLVSMVLTLSSTAAFSASAKSGLADGWYSLSIQGVPVDVICGRYDMRPKMVANSESESVFYVKNYGSNKYVLQTIDDTYLGVLEGRLSAEAIDDEYFWKLVAQKDGTYKIASYEDSVKALKITGEESSIKDGSGIGLWQKNDKDDAMMAALNEMCGSIRVDYYDFAFTPFEGEPIVQPIVETTLTEGWYNLSILGVPVEMMDGIMKLSAESDTVFYLKQGGEDKYTLKLTDGRYLGYGFSHESTYYDKKFEGRAIENEMYWKFIARDDGTFMLCPDVKENPLGWYVDLDAALNVSGAESSEGETVFLGYEDVDADQYGIKFTPFSGEPVIKEPIVIEDKTNWYQLSIADIPIDVTYGVTELKSDSDTVFLLTDYGDNKYSLKLPDGRYLGMIPSEYIGMASTEIYDKQKGLISTELCVGRIVEDEFFWMRTPCGDNAYMLSPYGDELLALNARGSNPVDGTIVDLYYTKGSMFDETYTIKFIPLTEISIGAEAKTHFSDVVANSFYEEAVVWALSKNITAGTSESTFSPTATCTKGQVITFLWRAMGEPVAKDTKNPFTDVNSNDYFYDAVLWAVEQGIIGGSSESSFSPNLTCTSAQVVTFLYRANGSPDETNQGESYIDAVKWGNAYQLLSGTDVPFAPNNQATRSEIVTYLYRNATK